MWTYVWIALLCLFIQYLILATIRIYREFRDKDLPQFIEENQDHIQVDFISFLLANRAARMILVVPVAFLCSFILLPYDLAHMWQRLQGRIYQVLKK